MRTDQKKKKKNEVNERNEKEIENCCVRTGCCPLVLPLSVARNVARISGRKQNQSAQNMCRKLKKLKKNLKKSPVHLVEKLRARALPFSFFCFAFAKRSKNEYTLLQNEYTLRVESESQGRLATAGGGMAIRGLE